MEKEQARAALRSAEAGTEKLFQPSPAPRKWRRVLKWLAAGNTLNRFEAARNLRDWCLNTTISQLEQRGGLTILRRDEVVPGHFGDVRCVRYWLSQESIARARELLGLSVHQAA